MGYFRQTIERMSPYVPGEQPAEAEVVKLNTNENPYPPSPAVMAAIAQISPDQLRRYPEPTARSFREAAARQFGVEPEMIICGNGMDELLRLLVQACCDSSRPLACPWPTYTLYEVLAEANGTTTIKVPFDADYRLPFEQLAATDARLVFVANPNSPSGTFTPIETLAKLADALRGRAILAIDEAYVDFADQSALALARTHENVIVLRTLSKGYSLAGLRFGFAIACRPLIDMLYKIKDSYNIDSIAIAAATAAIKDTSYARENCRKVVAERARLTERLEGLGFHVLPSQANFVLARPPKPAAKQLYLALKSRNIFVRWFDVDGLDDKVRITVGTPQQNDTLLEAIAEIIRQAE